MFVFGENSPAAGPNRRQPDFIQGARSKVVSVALKAHIMRNQGVHYRLAIVKILVEIEDEIVKPQLLWFPSG